MSSRVTAAGIAAHLGVAKSTVTHVLSGRATQLRISEATQARVLEAAKEMGYRPNLSARAMSTGRFGSAALIQPLNGLYLPHWLLLGLADELQKNDMSLTVSQAPDAALSDTGYLPKVVRELAADGLLINMLGEIPASFLGTLQALNTPAIWINNKQKFDAVHPDDVRAGRMATEHLLHLGHKKIAFLVGGALEGGHYSVADRRRGYEKTMQAAGLEPKLAALPAMPATWEEFRADGRIEAACRFLQQPKRPTAIVAYGLHVALPMLQAAAQVGLRVPQDLSLVMFAEEPNGHIGRPVTTVCSNIGDVAREAVQMLVRKIEQPAETLKAQTVPPWLFEGDTCAPRR